MPSFRSTLIDLETHTRRRHRYLPRVNTARRNYVPVPICSFCSHEVQDTQQYDKPTCCLDCRERLIGAVTVCEPDSSGGLTIVDDLYSKIETMDVCIETKSGKKVWSYLIRRIAELARKA